MATRQELLSEFDYCRLMNRAAWDRLIEYGKASFDLSRQSEDDDIQLRFDAAQQDAIAWGNRLTKILNELEALSLSEG